MSGEIPSAPGLLGRWGFNEGAGGADGCRRQQRQWRTTACSAAPSAGCRACRSATVNHAPDPPIVNGPGNAATGVTSPVTLDVYRLRRDADPLTVTYYGRRKAVAGPDFTSSRFPTRSTTSTTPAFARRPSRPRRTGSSPTGRRSTSRSCRTSATSPSTRTRSSVEWQRADTSIQVLDVERRPLRRVARQPRSESQPASRELLRPVLPAVAVPRAARGTAAISARKRARPIQPPEQGQLRAVLGRRARLPRHPHRDRLAELRGRLGRQDHRAVPEPARHSQHARCS